MKNPGGTILMKIPYKSVRRKNGAVPSQFAWTVHMNKSSPIIEDLSTPLETGSSVASFTTKLPNNFSFSADSKILSDSKLSSSIGTTGSEVGQCLNSNVSLVSTSIQVDGSQISNGLNSFSCLTLENLAQAIRLPTKWSLEYLSQDGSSILVFSERSCVKPI